MQSTVVQGHVLYIWLLMRVHVAVHVVVRLHNIQEVRGWVLACRFSSFTTCAALHMIAWQQT